MANATPSSPNAVASQDDGKAPVVKNTKTKNTKTLNPNKNKVQNEVDFGEGKGGKVTNY